MTQNGKRVRVFTVDCGKRGEKRVPGLYLLIRADAKSQAEEGIGGPGGGRL